MHIASGVILAAGNGGRVGEGLGAVLLLFFAYVLFSGGNKEKPRSKGRSQAAGGVLVAGLLLGLAAGYGGGSSPSAPTTPTRTTRPPAVVTHRPSTHKVTPPKGNGSNDCAGKLICFHN